MNFYLLLEDRFVVHGSLLYRRSQLAPNAVEGAVASRGPWANLQDRRLPQVEA
jgi:hypothetical protein